jgi:ribosome-associated protein
MFQADELARDLGELLAEHRGGDVRVLDLRPLQGWTDFFVIATVTSGAHLQGLERHIKDFCGDREVEIIRRSRAAGTEDEWRLIDLGPLVIHLMSARAREFYELERLWDAAPPAPPEGRRAAEPSYSSNSS